MMGTMGGVITFCFHPRKPTYYRLDPYSKIVLQSRCILVCWMLFAEYGSCYRSIGEQKHVVHLLNRNCLTTETPETGRTHTDLFFPIQRIANQLHVLKQKSFFSTWAFNFWALFTFLWEKEGVTCNAHIINIK